MTEIKIPRQTTPREVETIVEDFNKRIHRDDIVEKSYQILLPEGARTVVAFDKYNERVVLVEICDNLTGWRGWITNRSESFESLTEAFDELLNL